MLLEIIVIVLRETLEASILIAVLLSVSQHQGVRLTWMPVSLLVGLICAVGYGLAMGEISEWFDYAGQEVVNASLQLWLYVLIAALIPAQWLGVGSLRRPLCNLMAAVVFLALVREGAEIYIFYSGFLQQDEVLLKALTSGFVGLAVGLSIGAIVFYTLTMVNPSTAKLLHATVLALVAAGMVLQATQLLMQVDWLSSREPLWDSNWLLAEVSIAGQMAYAVFGYEATPSLAEVAAYGSAIAGLVGVTLLTIKFCSKEQAVSKGVQNG